MARARKILFLIIYLALTAFFSFAFYDRYYRHIDCFNDDGRCYQSATATVYTTGGMVWGLFATAFAMLALMSLIRVIVHKPKPKPPKPRVQAD